MVSWSVFGGWWAKQKLLQNSVVQKTTQALFIMQVAMARYDFLLLFQIDYLHVYALIKLKYVCNFVPFNYRCSELVEV